VAKARKQAAELVKKARADGADFAALVKAHSQDEATAARGGDTGWAPLTQLLPEMRAAVAALKKGAVSEPVQSPAGFHVLKLVDYRAAVTPGLGQVEDQLRDALRRQRKGTVAKAYLDGLVDAGTLSIDGATLSAAFDAVR
ncbi:MAG: peptidylprolyl isomerase, partial [Pollutimonas bauzanensis]